MPLPRVLVVEDDPAIRALLLAALRREPFEIDSAEDGVEALQFIQGNEYAVILLDLMLPRMNGAEFLQAFRDARPDARSVIFIMTAFDDATVRRYGPGLVHAIVRKPFDVPQLVAMVREVALLWSKQVPERPSLRPVVDEGDETIDVPAPEPTN